MAGVNYRKPYKAITDTGTSIIVAPGKIVRLFAAVRSIRKTLISTI
jgi:hypothetical protein